MTDVQNWISRYNDTELAEIHTALFRERIIREGMAQTGEDRQTVADYLDASMSMDQEAVLDLMDGEPTTLAAGLRRYVDELGIRDELQTRDRIVSDLMTLLIYPWPDKV